MGTEQGGAWVPWGAPGRLGVAGGLAGGHLPRHTGHSGGTRAPSAAASTVCPGEMRSALTVGHAQAPALSLDSGPRLPISLAWRVTRPRLSGQSFPPADPRGLVGGLREGRLAGTGSQPARGKLTSPSASWGVPGTRCDGGGDGGACRGRGTAPTPACPSPTPAPRAWFQPPQLLKGLRAVTSDKAGLEAIGVGWGFETPPIWTTP